MNRLEALLQVIEAKLDRAIELSLFDVAATLVLAKAVLVAAEHLAKAVRGEDR